MTIKCLFYWFVLILLFAGVLQAGSDFIKIQSQSATSLTIQANFPDLNKRSDRHSNGDSQVYFEIPGMQLRQQESYAVVPFTTKLFSLPGKKITYRIKNIKKNTIKLKSGEQFAVVHSGKTNKYIQKSDLVEIKYQGLFRDIPLYTVTFFPLQYDPAGNSVDYIYDLQIEISSSGSTGSSINSNSHIGSFSRNDDDLNSKLLLNSNFAPAKTPYSINNISINTQKYKENRYKISVGETGLYQITYEDLAKYEIPVEQFDTKKLKILCRGLELPIYFKGGEDGSFDPGDYFEFWGEINRSPLTEKYADVYNDPFSDINIYWMEIGETTGLRMVEESGSLAEANPQNYITPYAFTERIHFEKDNAFIRFGGVSTDIDSAGYTMDHWFYDRGISAVSSRSYDAEIIWPFTDIGSRSVFVKANFRSGLFSIPWQIIRQNFG
jgi:hypothetical protein